MRSQLPLNIIDLVAILPYYISLAVGSRGASSLAIIRILRLSRVLRLFKMSRHNEGLRNMIECFAATGKEIVLFGIIITLSCILFGAAIFYADRDSYDSFFYSIPRE